MTGNPPSSRKWKMLTFLVACSLSAIGSAPVGGLELPGPAPELKGSAQAVPRTLFGMHMHRADTTTPWPGVKFGSWRLWDAYVAWPSLEPAKGKWDFRKLDRYLAMAKLTGVEILLPLGLSPTWASARPAEKSGYGPGNAAEPRDTADWRNYVRVVAERYKGRVRHYEIWNEPNDKAFYTGGVAGMVELTRIASEELKRVDPEIRIVSPAVTGGGKEVKWLDDFLGLGGGAHVDVIGYHFYVPHTKPEAMLEIINDVRRVMARHGVDKKPLWNTETGWLTANEGGGTDDGPFQGWGWKKLDRVSTGAYIARAHILSWAAGVERFYWYSWDGGPMGFLEPNSKAVKQHAVIAYARTLEWLVGSVVSGCRKFAGVWRCTLTDSKGQSAWIVWTEDETRISWPLPQGAQLREIEHLDGNTEAAMEGQKTVGVSQRPVLLRLR